MVETDNQTKSPEGSPAGDDGSHSGAGKAPMAKDKICQYCHQAFTSSSLGRHLDQYLFKKKPDGIHNVDEIRRIRSSITRRQARTSGKRDSPDIGSGKNQVDSAGSTTHDSAGRPREGPRFLFNTPTWHSTGVINNIPEMVSQETANPTRTPAFQSRAAPSGPWDYSNRVAATKDADNTRALELALREVLDSIKAATETTRTRLAPFEFDVQAQTYPSLVLHMLPAPPTLFATHPFPTTGSFPLDPPGVGQVEVVRHALRAHIEQWRNEQFATPSTNQSGSRDGSVAQDPNLINRTAQQHDEMSARHLDLAYQNWMVLPNDVKKDAWLLEITRAFARETEKRKESEKQFARVQQEANQLRAQIEKLGSCQWPREFALFPPDMLPLSRDAARELTAHDSDTIGPGAGRWDYDHLLAKWRRVVFHDKSMGRVGLGSYGDTEDPALDSAYRSKINASTPESHTTSPVVGHSQSHSSGPSNQQTSSYASYDSNRNTSSGPQAKRPRLMNGIAKNSNGNPDGDAYRASPQNGNSTAWSPGSVQSLLSNNPQPPASTSFHRYGTS
ncbi:hypothetical protein BGW36DRAFT_297343 [Talaromyces proteolyticus]|uniref:Uncharacterized protein n=1 Tax=Talaromyces proteolyticus TaxID=1131652 RepID=A0AAD4PZQ8_9EURO|nr:uncharacterized protein BGW36DRAFT_297343 [Talaromyces proteolyticus]KAH8696231.1 hypothetical protein BGW36DRAFT_297343 [Talaromyces proteolyticus]